MAAQTALHARNAAAASLKDSIRELTRFKVKPNPNKRLLQSKLDRVLNDKENLVDKHYTYAEKAALDLDSEDMLGWLTPKLDDATDLTDEVEILIDNLNTTEDTAQKQLDNNELQRALTNEINVAKLQYQSDEKTLRDRITLMMGVVNDENTASAMTPIGFACT